MTEMILANGLFKRYGSKWAVRDINFKVEAGEVFGYVGQNGAGKSTTIKMLTGLLEPTRGNALIGGFDIQKEPDRAKQLLGYLPEVSLFYKNMTAYEFLDFFGRLYGLKGNELEDRIYWLLKVVQLEDDDKYIASYSKGMKQRLGLARALIHEPKVVFLDEPSSGLDPSGRKLIRKIIAKLGEGDRTVFLSSHDLHEISVLCDRAALIYKGEIKYCGDASNMESVWDEIVGSLEEDLVDEYDIYGDGNKGGKRRIAEVMVDAK
ncbi:MAG: ABC transporter ATP-binding protein [Thermoplasmata archaeon]